MYVLLIACQYFTSRLRKLDFRTPDSHAIRTAYPVKSPPCKIMRKIISPS